MLTVAYVQSTVSAVAPSAAGTVAASRWIGGRPILAPPLDQPERQQRQRLGDERESDDLDTFGERNRDRRVRDRQPGHQGDPPQAGRECDHRQEVRQPACGRRDARGRQQQRVR
jgi:hypothetical protein